MISVPAGARYAAAADRGAAERVKLERVSASAYVVPTESPESDGTYAWRSTTIVIAEAHAAGRSGTGYSYADRGAAETINHLLAPALEGVGALAVPEAWVRMQQAVRNIGRPGVAASAIAAVDTALWDLKARLLDVSLLDLLGAARDRVELYGSGGFTSQTVNELQRQLGGWAAEGFRHVKMKVGRDPAHDVHRVRSARDAVGPGVELFVDANGAYRRKQALAMAERFAEFRVCWFEEPVSSDDVDGLRLIRDRAPAGMDIAAGEYGYDLFGLRRLLEAGAVDVLQADATRCAGITGFLKVAALCEARGLPLSAHTAPALHVSPCCAAPPVCHLEYFADHARLEWLLFDGVQLPNEGTLAPDRSRPGLGLDLKRADAARYAV